MTKWKPFDVILGDTHALDPLDFTDKIPVTNYVNVRKIRLQELYKRIHDGFFSEKTKTVIKRNENRDNHIKFSEGQRIFVLNRKAIRNKASTHKKSSKKTILEK